MSEIEINKPIALIGYRGSGKSTISKILAQKLGYKLFELDHLIDERAGEKIPEIVAKFGWERFRQMETEILTEIVKTKNAVLDLGGGIVEKQENRKLIQENCRVVWLKAKPEILIDRIKGSTYRPSLTGKSIVDEVPEVLARREPLYQGLADLSLDTGELSPEQAVSEIIRHFGLKQKT